MPRRLQKGTVLTWPGKGLVVVGDVEKFADNTGEAYVLQATYSSFTARVKVNAVSDEGLRPPVTSDVVPRILEVVTGEPEPLPTNPERRRPILHERVHGTTLDLAAALRDVRALDNPTVAERALITRARSLLAEEVAYAEKINHNEALELLAKGPDGLADIRVTPHGHAP